MKDLGKRKLSICTQMLLYGTVFMLTSFMVVSLFVFDRYEDIRREKAEAIALQTTSSLDVALESTVNNVNGISKMIVGDIDVQRVLETAPGEIPIDSVRMINKVLSLYINNIKSISSIFVYDFYGNIYSQNTSTLNLFPLQLSEAEWYDAIKDTAGEAALLYLPGSKTSSNYGNNDVLFVRVINSTSTQKPIGAIAMILTPDIGQLFRSLNLQKGSVLALLDAENTAVYRNAFEAEIWSNDLISLAKEMEEDTVLQLDDGKYGLCCKVLPEYGWKLILAFPYDVGEPEIAQFRQITFFSLVAMLLLCVLAMYIISKRITVPLAVLTNRMKEITQEHFEPIGIQSSVKEISALVTGFNYMSDSIEQLLKKVVEEQQVKQKAELNVLQEQIKPHFLYNTLDAIHALILLGDYDKASTTITRLGSFYRTSLSHGRTVISLEEEFSLTQNYLFIQNVRYAEMFEVEYQLEDQIKDARILKLILQPFVENSIYHGIKPLDRKGKILIFARKVGESVELKIEDDGAGAPQEIFDRILNEKMDVNATSFGLRGTILRLQYYYGKDSCHVEINSKQGEGTRVRIIFPYERYSREEYIS